MQIKYLKFIKKWVAIFNGRAIAVGNTNKEALSEAFVWLKEVKGVKHN